MVRKGLLYGKFEVATESLYSQFMMGELDDMEKADRRKGGALVGIKGIGNTRQVSNTLRRSHPFTPSSQILNP